MPDYANRQPETLAEIGRESTAIDVNE